jgi:hypothetical protein
MTIQDGTDGKTQAISPPRWMTKVEKREFAGVIEARNNPGNPVLTTETDLIVDYVSSRSRIAALRSMLKDAMKDAKEYPPSQRHAAGLIRQIDTTTAMSRRLARDLRLNEPPTKEATDD